MLLRCFVAVRNPRRSAERSATEN